MSDPGLVHEWDPVFAAATLLFAGIVLGQVAVLSIRRWAGVVVPDYSGWEPQQILVDRRTRLVLGLLLSTAWVSITISLLRRALQAGVIQLLGSHLGPVPIPQWLALALQDGHRIGLTYGLWATGLWLDQSVSKHWSRPRPTRTPMGQPLMAMMLAVLAIGFSVLD